MIDWLNIDTVFLDLDGTLLDLRFDNYFWHEYLPRRYGEIHQIPHDKAATFVHSELAAVKGTLNWYCIDHWTKELKVDIAALKREVQDRIAIRPQVEQFLQALTDADKEVVLLTNGHRTVVELKFERTNIQRYFDAVVCALDHGIAKEEPGFWPMFSSIRPFNCARSLFVDDNLAVLEAARDFGIKHLVCIRQPDSGCAPQACGDFPAIEHFDMVLPPPASSTST